MHCSGFCLQTFAVFEYGAALGAPLTHVRLARRYKDKKGFCCEGQLTIVFQDTLKRQPSNDSQVTIK